MIGAGPPNGYLEAALDLFDEFGPAAPSLALGVDAFAALAGVTRTTIYRHWETINDVNRDAACFIVSSADVWQRRFLEQPVAHDLGAAISASLGGPIDQMALGFRMLAAGWPGHVEARQFIQQFEAAWLEQLAAWIAAHCSATGRTMVNGSTPMVAAIALVAMVEGRVTLAMLRSGMAEEDQSSDEHVAIADLADHLLDRMTLRQPDPIVEDAPNRWTPAALPYYRLTEAQRVLGERCLARLSPAPSLQSWLPDPNRLVDVGRLARRLGVSERRIYAAWPGTAGMNRDLLTAVFERERGRVESLAETAIAIGSDGEYTTFELLLSTALNALVRSTARPGHVNYFAGTAALADLEVARLVSARIEGWRSSVRIMFLAVMAMSGANRRPGITATVYSDTMMESVMGLQRLVALHPGLADRRVVHRGELHPICGLALLEIGSSLTTNGSPGQADPAMPAPPLP